MKGHMRVHLVNGEVIEGAGEETDLTDEDISNAKSAIADVVMGSGGWQLNIELPDGNWAVFPKQSVLYVELIVEKE